MKTTLNQPSVSGAQEAVTVRWWPLWACGALFYIAFAAYGAGWMVSALTARHAHAVGNPGIVAARMVTRGVNSAWHPAPNTPATWSVFVLVLVPGLWAAWRFGLGRLLEDVAPRSVDGARWAGPRDEQRLVVPDDPQLRPGRMVAGRSMHGKHLLLAGEDCASVTAFGTSGAGKTFRLLVPNLLEWQGPAIMSTTRGPDLDALIARRSQLGPCWIIAPGGVAGHPIACWSPVDYAVDEASAFRMADWLATAAQDRIGVAEENRPWVEQATSLIAPLLLGAHLSGGGIAQFVRWVRAGTEAEHTVIQHLTAAGYDTMARELTTLRHIHDRGQGSVRFTAFTITRPYRTPEVLASAARTDIDVGALIDQCGTVFLVSPVSEAIYAPMFTALTASILHEATRRYETTGQALKPRLGVFLDEAGNVFRYARLAALLTNVRAMGIELMTIWHDLAQLETLYGPTEARTILSQSRMRMLLPGVADDHTLDYFSALIGQTVYERPSRTIATDGRNSASAAPHTEPLAPAWRLTQQPAGTAVVQYDNLPATRVTLRDYFKDAELQRLAHAPAIHR